MQPIERDDTVRGSVCKHCARGLAKDQPEFCCSGCATVYHILHERQLTDYYRIQQMADGGSPDLRDRERTDFAFLASQTYWNDQVSELADGTFKVTWYLRGLTCAACVWLIERVLDQQQGIRDHHVSLSAGTAVLIFDGRFNAVSLANELDQFGYRVSLLAPQDEAEDGSSDLLRLGIAGALAGNCMLMSLPFYVGLDTPGYGALFGWITALLSLPVMLYAARPFFNRASLLFSHRYLTLDFPIAIGLISGEGLSLVQLMRGNTHGIYFDSLAMLVFFLLLGRYIQQRGVQRSLLQTRQLVAAMPQMVTRADGDSWKSVTAQELAPGDRIQIPCGGLVPVDGLLESTEAVLNLHVVSGESVPVTRQPGEQIPAGSVNLGAAFVMTVATAYCDSDRERLRSLAQSLKGRSELPKEPLTAARFTTVVTLAALSAFLFHLSRETGLAWQSALTILIVACPCALALARPTAVSFALSQAARRGIWIRSLEALDEAARVRTAVFDKTGVLTSGAPTLIEAHWLISREHWLKGAILSLENGLNHPVAQAFRASFHAAPAITATAVNVLPGYGVSGWVDGHRVVIAARAGLKRFGCDTADLETQLKPLKLTADATHVMAFVDGQLAAAFELRDQLLPDAAATIAHLKDAQIKLRVLSGDRPAHVTATCSGLEFDDVRGGVGPSEKLSLMRQAKVDDGHVMMVGDGLNDMGALASASLAVTHTGATDAALQFADVVVPQGGLAKVASVMELARRTQQAIRRGIWASLAYNLVAITLAWLGLIGPLWAAILMPLSSISVIVIAGTTLRGAV